MNPQTISELSDFFKAIYSVAVPWTKDSAEYVTHYGLRSIPLSEHFNLREFLVSSYLTSKTSPGIVIFPEHSVIVDNLHSLCVDILEPIRVAYGKPLYVSSGYRPKYLNDKIRGARNSLHMFGKAADLFFPSSEKLSEFCDFMTDFLSDPRNEHVNSSIREYIVNCDKYYVHLSHI